MNSVKPAGRRGHPVAQERGGSAQRHRVEAGQQRAEEGRRAGPGRPQPLGEQRRELVGAPAEARDGDRVLTGRVDGHGVVVRAHVVDEGEGDPPGRTVRDDEQRVLEDVQVHRGPGDRRGEPGGIAHRARPLCGDLSPRISQFRQQLRAHPAEPAQLKSGTVGERDEHGVRLRLADRGDRGGLDAQRRAVGGLEFEYPASEGHVAGAPLQFGPVGRDEPVLGGGHDQLAAVPHSPQNLAPFSVVPQFPQNFLSACAAASG